MDIKRPLVDVGVGLAAGYVGTKAMEAVAMGLYQKVEPEQDREQEDAVRPGPPFKIAAEKTAALAGVELKGTPLKVGSMAFHYGLGMIWGPVYGLLRRYSGMSPSGAAFTSGASMSLVVDEAMTPALGFSAPSRD